MTEPAEEQPNPATIARPEPVPSGGVQEPDSPFTLPSQTGTAPDGIRHQNENRPTTKTDEPENQ